MQSTILSMQQPHNHLVNNEGMPSSNQREELHQAGMVVACFVLPAEQAEKLISMLQDIARNPATAAPPNLVQPAITSLIWSAREATFEQFQFLIGVRTERDDWLAAAGIDRGKLFRRVNKVGGHGEMA